MGLGWPGSTPTSIAHSAIVDIGSNSIRLVVYGGPERIPAILFNEKVLAGLGRALAGTGAIDADAMAAARAALERFAWLTREMAVPRVRTVATAAVRDAANGAELIALAHAAGLTVEILSGEEEAQAAGHGVLSAIPQADGIVGDLGGGSLELVRVKDGQLGERVSFPLGVLRLGAIRAKGAGELDRTVARMIAAAGWTGQGQGLPLYLVGGSWRALARLDMHLTGYPLPIAHGYALSPARISALRKLLAEMPRADLRLVPNLSGGRVPTLDHAAAVLAYAVRHLGCATTVISAYGLREGLLYAALPAKVRATDPLLVAAHDEGARQGRFAEHGDLLHRWIAPLFPQDDPAMVRLRHTACLLADVGWHANPEFRAERGVEIALHGNWVAVDAAGRAIVAQALHCCLGGGSDTPEPLGRLAPPDALAIARRWGLAMRLGQRLSGGVAAPLKRTALRRGAGGVELLVTGADASLYGEAVQKRHKALATALGMEAALVTR
ncbi:Ppx/GppA family phosphatase [Sphingomonas sp. Leaf25]|uniref:Ppx/GppA family phosphatase n=1 Tax=Sphingomonas sp. Leaf25 TaxID=1735692 RepID=UPI0006F43FD7|nr:Ppx/GppA family phosphatase [Sphingomonas sp. Leaf25]KQN04169.1 exopolyphosphatase [Sphingomonas sp. Leaf25]